MEVKVTNLAKSFAGSAANALKGISFAAESGRITSLVGASGCGKTTTLRCIAGLESIDAGEICFGDSMVASAGRSIVPTAKRNIGMVFQSYALWPHFNVAENIAFALKTRNWAKARIEQRVKEILGLINLQGFGERYPAQLSGGQQQRVAVGRALAYEPAVLLLDEPLANLDSHLRGQMRQEIRQLQRKTGITMVYVTHDRAEAMELSDKVVILDHGQIVQTGPPATLFERPANALVARYLGHTNFVSVSRVERTENAFAIETALGSCRVESCDPASLQEPMSLLIGTGAMQLASAQRSPPAGWLSGIARVTTAARVNGGELCVVTTEAGALELFVAEQHLVSVGDELQVIIDPLKCRILPGDAGNA